MLLVLADRRDAGAAALSVWLHAEGVPHRLVQDLAQVRVSVRLDSDGRARVALDCDVTGSRVTGVINRGYVHDAQDDGFVASETLAAWWSALALFGGAVVNRPNRRGLLPWSWTSDLSRVVAGAQTLITHHPPPPGVRRGHKYDPASGVFSGQLQADEPSREAFGTPQVVRLFDPTSLIHLLIAGRRVFDLSRPERTVARSLVARVWRVLSAHEVTGPLFAHAVLTGASDQDGLLRLNLMPPLEYYQSVAPLAHAAVVEAFA